MRKKVSLLLAVLLLCSVASVPAYAGGGVQAVSCPEQGFSVLCDADYEWEFSPANGITIYTEQSGSIPYVLVYKVDEEIEDAAAYIREQFTPYMESKYGDSLILTKEYTSLSIGGREMPVGLYSYLLQGYQIDMLRAYDVREGYSIAFTAKFIHGEGDATMEALHEAVKSYRADPEYYANLGSGRWNYDLSAAGEDGIRYTFGEVCVTVPLNWAGKYSIQVNEDSVSFYQTVSRQLCRENYGFDGGLLFSVGYSETEDYRDLPSYAELGDGVFGHYYLAFPTDYQPYDKDEAAVQEYSEMYSQVAFVREHSYSLLSRAA